MIEQALEDRLRRTFVEARQKRYPFVTVEQVLMALLDVPSAKEVLEGCGTNVDELRNKLGKHINDSTSTEDGTEEVDSQPTDGFSRVLQQAIMYVPAQDLESGKKQVTGAHILMAIYREKGHAVYFLHGQGVTRLDVFTFIQNHSRPQG